MNAFSHVLTQTSVQWLNNQQGKPSFYLYLLFDKFNKLSNLFSKKTATIQGNVFLFFIFPGLKGINVQSAVTRFVIVLSIYEDYSNMEKLCNGWERCREDL